MKTLKILAIDDEPIICQSLKLFLEEFQFIVHTAENGIKGLELFSQSSYDIVITDLIMPELSGLEVVKKIREINPSIPIIVASGVDKVSDALEAINAGAWDYIAKPITDMNVLRFTIDRAIEKANLKRENLEYQQHLEKLALLKTKDLENTINELNENREHLRQIFNALSDMVFVTDLHGIIISVNPIVSIILKKETHSLIGECIDTLFPQTQNMTLLTQTIALLQLQETVNTNDFYVTLNDCKHRFRVSAKEIEAEDNLLQREAVVVLTDITEVTTGSQKANGI